MLKGRFSLSRYFSAFKISISLPFRHVSPQHRKASRSTHSSILANCQRLAVCAAVVLVLLPVCWLISSEGALKKWNRAAVKVPAFSMTSSWIAEDLLTSSSTLSSPIPSTLSFFSSWLSFPPLAAVQGKKPTRLLSVHWTDLNADSCPDLLTVWSAPTPGCPSQTTMRSLINTCCSMATASTVKFISNRSICNSCVGAAISEEPVSFLSLDIDGDFKMELIVASGQRLEKMSPEVDGNLSETLRAAGVQAGLPLLSMDWDKDGLLEVLYALRNQNIANSSEMRYHSVRAFIPNGAINNNKSVNATARFLHMINGVEVFRAPFDCRVFVLAVMETDLRPSLLCFGISFPRDFFIQQYHSSRVGLLDVTDRYRVHEVVPDKNSFQLPPGVVLELSDVCVTDFNKDGIADYAIASAQGTWLWLSANHWGGSAHVQYSKHLLQPNWMEGSLFHEQIVRSVACLDVDNDGDVDLFALYAPIIQCDNVPCNAFFVNDGHGKLRYGWSIETTTSSAFSASAVSVADYDNDGRLDLLLAHSAGAALFRNSPRTEGVVDAHWLEVTLWGLHTCNSFGIGVIVQITAGAGLLRSHRIVHAASTSASQYVSPFVQHHHRLHFGLGNFSVVDEVLVVWPCASAPQRFDSVQADQILQIIQLNNRVPVLPPNLVGTLGDAYHFNNSLRLCARKGEKRLSPSFFVIGQFKCGTTSLAASLVAHPQIKGASQKELNYWNLRALELGLDWYAQNFPCGTGEQITFEASPEYFGHERVPFRLLKAFPRAKMILLLRDPVSRAFSHYRMRLRAGRSGSFLSLVHEELDNLRHCVMDFIGYGESEPLSNQQLANETLVPFPALSKCVAHGQGIITGGLYAVMLKRWWQMLGPSRRGQLLILHSEQFDQRPDDVLTAVHGFLEVKVIKRTFRRANVGSNIVGELDTPTLGLLRSFFLPFNVQLCRMIQREDVHGHPTPCWIDYSQANSIAT